MQSGSRERRGLQSWGSAWLEDRIPKRRYLAPCVIVCGPSLNPGRRSSPWSPKCAVIVALQTEIALVSQNETWDWGSGPAHVLGEAPVRFVEPRHAVLGWRLRAGLGPQMRCSAAAALRHKTTRGLCAAWGTHRFKTPWKDGTWAVAGSTGLHGSSVCVGAATALPSCPSIPCAGRPARRAGDPTLS